jgi:hypothetical protein
MSEWKDSEKRRLFDKYWGNCVVSLFYHHYYNSLYKKITTSDYKPWDILFNYSMRMNNGYCITPYTNLAMDVGIIGENHLNRKESPFGEIGVETDMFELNEEEMQGFSSFDWQYFSRVCLPHRIIKKIKLFFNEIGSFYGQMNN